MKRVLCHGSQGAAASEPRRYPFVAAAIAAALASSFVPAWAGEVAGRVTDAATGRALPNAAIKAPQLGRSAISDRTGAYRITDVPAGSYAIEVQYVGFAGVTSNVTVADTGVTEQNFSLSGTVVAEGLEEITVTGYRLAQATALQDKKSSNVIKDSVTADDAGKLPDRNAAEALRRVTGVSVTVDQGEGRYVTVRGIDPSFTNITLDNQVIGTPEGDTRRVALDTIPAELLSKLEVIKAVTPDMDGNSVGGSVNIVTPSAFDDPDGRFFSAAVDAGYYDLNGKTPYSASLGWGQVFGANDQFGVVLSGNYSYREYDSENLQGGDPWVEEGDFFVPDEFVLRDYTIERERKGFVANFEWQATDNAKLYFRNLFNRFEDTELQSEVVSDYRNGDLLDQTPTSGTFTEGEGERLISQRLEIQSIQTSSLGGEFTFGDWKLGVSATYGEADQDTPYDREWSFELDEEMPMTYDTRGFFEVDAGPEFQDPERYEFNQYNRGGQLVEEEVRVGQIDLERLFNAGGRDGSIKFGGKVVNRDKTSDQNMAVYDGFEDDLLMTPFAEPGKDDFYASEHRYVYGPRIRYDLVESFYASNAGGFEENVGDTALESFGVDYTITEDVTAAYVMGTVELGRAVLIGGVRMERTESEYTAFDVVLNDGDLDSDPTPVSGSKDYTNWLPGLQVRFNASDDLIVRAAWTNTIGRPSYETTVPFRLFDIQPDDDVAFEGEIETGNADLDPLESMNFDASFEWYLEAGIVSAGLFYKDIDNPIFARFTRLEDVDFEGRFFSDLTIMRPENADSGEILGLELNFQQQFRALPAPFDGLGASVNYTYSDSESQVFDRPDELPFFLQSEHVGNIALFYEKRGVELRLAYTYRSEYLDTLGDSPETDLWVDAHGQLDFKSSYEFTPNLTAFLQFTNLTDEPLRLLSGDGRRLAENEIYSWNAIMGVQLKF